MSQVVKGNKFYQRKVFQLVNVSFTKHKSLHYTYVAHEKQNVKVGDWVVVPTGAPENVFSSDVAYNHAVVAKVESIMPSDDVVKIPHMIKPVISVVNHKMYDQITTARHKK